MVDDLVALLEAERQHPGPHLRLTGSWEYLDRKHQAPPEVPRWPLGRESRAFQRARIAVSTQREGTFLLDDFERVRVHAGRVHHEEQLRVRLDPVGGRHPWGALRERLDFLTQLHERIQAVEDGLVHTHTLARSASNTLHTATISRVTPATRIPILTAPTAAGKTALALRLACDHPIEVVSADAFLVYRGMDIGTAKPTREERLAVPHHLIDVRNPWEDYDVTQFVRDAEHAIRCILERGRVPLVVGGTGFYLAALLKGLPTTPRADTQLQASIEAELAERGLDALIQEIAEQHPGEVQRLQRNPRRVVRALEVYRRTGRFPSEYPFTQPAFAYDVVAFAPPPDELQLRVEARVDAMLAAGLVDEVRRVASSLEAHGRRPTSMQAIGYKEVLACLDGQGPLDDIRAVLIQATRSYAKRQITWIRTQLHTELLPGEEHARVALRRLLDR